MIVCPHWFGWVYTPSRRRRFCRMCARQQVLVGTSWRDARPWGDRGEG